MLPFSAEYPICPITQFPSNNPPFVPQLQLLNEGLPLVPHVASVIANEAGIYATQSPARMFCFNMLASNGWQNNAYAEVIKLSVDSAILKSRMGITNTPAAVAVDAAREVLILYTSMLVMTYPELGSFMQPQQVQAAAANYGVYTDLLNQIGNMYAQTVGYQAPQVAARHAPVSNAVGGRQMYSQRPAQGQALTNKAASVIYQGSNQRQESEIPKRFPNPKAIQVNAAREEKEASPTKVIIEETTSNFVSGEIENMDREQHSIVYFGKTFEIPTAPLRRKLEEAVETHEALSKRDERTETPYISDEWIAETSLDDLIALNRARSIIQNDGNFGAYVSYGLVVTPVISEINLSPMFEELSRSATFMDMARVLGEYPMRFQDTEVTRKILAAVSQIDRFMTKIVQGFLDDMIEYRGMVLSSFIDDAKDIAKWCVDKDGGRYNPAYINFQRGIMTHLFKHTRAVNDESDEVSRIIDYGDQGDKLYWDNMVTSYSVTLITASSQELGYNVSSKGKEVSGKITPMLRRLVDAIQRTNGKTASVSNNLIITSDDVRYAVYPLNGNYERFTIKEV